MEEKFLKASQDIKKSKDLDNDTLLSLYGYYKQATCGPCDITEPYRIYYKEHAKYIAWNNNKDVSKEDAMKYYVRLVNKILKEQEKK